MGWGVRHSDSGFFQDICNNIILVAIGIPVSAGDGEEGCNEVS